MVGGNAAQFQDAQPITHSYYSAITKIKIIINAKEAIDIFNDGLPKQTIDEQKLQRLDESIRAACANKQRRIFVPIDGLNDKERTFITGALGYTVCNVDDGERKLYIGW